MKPTQAPAGVPAAENLQRIREELDAGRLQSAWRLCQPLLESPSASANILALAGEVAYRRRDLDSAASSLEKALAADRRHARANWLLGNVAQDRGALDRAIASYRRALRADADFVEAHNDLGTAYFGKGWHQEAEQCYRRALELQPDNIPATQNLASALRAQGKFGEARSAFARTLVLRLRKTLGKLFRHSDVSAPASGQPANKEEFAAIKVLFGQGKLEEASCRLEASAQRSPEDAEVHYWRGRISAARGSRGEAIAHIERAIAVRSSAPEFHITLGNVLTDERRYEDALREYQTALALDPGSAAATANIARVLHEQGHYREAEEVFRLSLREEPQLGDAHANYAGTLLSLGKYAEAEQAARAALEINRRSLPALMMLATALVEQGRLDEALAAAREAETIDGGNATVLRWLGAYEMAFRADLGAAERLLEKAKAGDPGNPAIHINLARLLLIQERFEQGWEEYEWRKRESVRAHVYTELPYREWEGQSLEGKALLVNGEQGLGDEIMFASCLAEIAANARRCVLFCNRRLEPLFRRSFPFAEVIGGSNRTEQDRFPVVEGIDYQVAAGSLPRFLRRRAADFPRHAGYLRADPAKVDAWRARLSSLGAGPKIGLSWKGGTPLSDATRRTLSLESFDRILSKPAAHWVSLQFGDCEAERRAFAARTGRVLHHWQEAIDDLDETAALMSALDLRITVCNTQVHLSGGLGLAVWVLAPQFPDWRYGYSGEGMAWYPQARLIRQSAAGDWQGPLAELERSLDAFLQGR